MHAIKSARHLITMDPESSDARVFANLVLALESESPFNVASLYDLDIKFFELALSILKEWRLDRYYAGKAKLFDMALQVRELPAQALDRH